MPQPLAFTPLAFTGHGLDRADNLRADPAVIADLRARPDARLLALDGLSPQLDDAHALMWTDCSGLTDEREAVFLGLDNGAPLFAAVPPAGDIRPAYIQRFNWAAVALMSGTDLAIYGGARSLIDWHARHRFCAQCGAPTVLAKGGWQRNCATPEDNGSGSGEGGCGASHFPRTDPVAIMLVENNGDLLLGRGERFPPRSYSALAGFIEPGESIEDAVSREVLEEAGVAVRDVTYIASQPWPFPSQLMIGCHGFSDTRELTVDYTELEDARWFTRDEVAEAMERGSKATSFVSPPKTAIAHYLLKQWLEKAA